MKYIGVILLTISFFSLTYCPGSSIKNFRVDEKIYLEKSDINCSKDFEIIIDENSLNELEKGDLARLEVISNETKKNYLLMINKFMCSKGNMEKGTNERNTSKLFYTFNHTIQHRKDSIVFVSLNVILHICSIYLYPIKFNVIHSVSLTVEDKSKVIFKKEIKESSNISFSFWYIFLLNYFSIENARNRIFYEKSIMLLNDFNKVNESSLKPLDSVK